MLQTNSSPQAELLASGHYMGSWAAKMLEWSNAVR